MQRELHVRFGGRAEETDRTKARHRASARPHWGCLGRPDVWLTREIRWKIAARAGDSETGRILRWEFDTEDEAFAIIKRLLAADAGGQWRKQPGDNAPPPSNEA
ncbi:hypothetical protein [Micromonospora cremea]|uniref:Uncharacterized protein n=1 Tax=Micromonospora cremea TaxID=709881 RepID=A0A1N5TCP6_9ACTN|nr:hypothetical protein [Micromonospora cremea]SIM46163.1 hypothetical protein SAMN04489832_0097 [Micromonospora cremea]